MTLDTDSRAIDQQQQRHQREEFRSALRSLLMMPLMNPSHENFVAVRRHAEPLREWFARETGWPLHVERDGARLYKRPADLGDSTRGLDNYDRRRYVLLSLACAVLERAEAQITLRVLGDRLLSLASEPALISRGFSFALTTQHERRELVAVCRTLLELGVLARVAGDEDAFVQATGTEADALYDLQRRALAGVLAAVRGPSTWAADDAPVTLEERLLALTSEPVADSDEGRRTALRHHLARRLLDDPVLYTEQLPSDARAYFINQRGVLAARIAEATALVPEQRAEGLAMVDATADLSDVAMPSEGTDAHATLLVAEFLAGRLRTDRHDGPVADHQVATFLLEARERFGRYWRRSAREPGAERELAATALKRLEMLRLVERAEGLIWPLPALARFALGPTDVRAPTWTTAKAQAITPSLFDPP